MATLTYLIGQDANMKQLAQITNEPCVHIEGDIVEINYKEYVVSHFNTIIVNDKIEYQIHLEEYVGEGDRDHSGFHS